MLGRSHDWDAPSPLGSSCTKTSRGTPALLRYSMPEMLDAGVAPWLGCSPTAVDIASFAALLSRTQKARPLLSAAVLYPPVPDILRPIVWS